MLFKKKEEVAPERVKWLQTLKADDLVLLRDATSDWKGVGQIEAIAGETAYIREMIDSKTVAFWKFSLKTGKLVSLYAHSELYLTPLQPSSL